jgi:hypothetical protein
LPNKAIEPAPTIDPDGIIDRPLRPKSNASLGTNFTIQPKPPMTRWSLPA